MKNNQIRRLLLIVVVFIAGIVVYQRLTRPDYSSIFKNISKESQLLVTSATVDEKVKHEFPDEKIESWPKWTRPFIGRNLAFTAPSKTEFKVQLEGVGEHDVTIKDETLRFKHPLVVNVDSQITGAIEPHNTSGVIDKIVDKMTAGDQAQTFLSEKMQSAMFDCSEKAIESSALQRSVLEGTQEDLEKLINLDNEDHIDVDLRLGDLKFVNIENK